LDADKNVTIFDYVFKPFSAAQGGACSTCAKRDVLKRLICISPKLQQHWDTPKESQIFA